MGLFSSKKAGFGLDVGSSAVKLVQLKEGSTGFALETFAIVLLPPDAIGEGMIKDPPVVVDAIKEVVGKARVKTKDAV
ncbi:MAG TPA: pilus assembly protein PilM, partial [Candidatus Methylomirabilis sp.]